MNPELPQPHTTVIYCPALLDTNNKPSNLPPGLLNNLCKLITDNETLDCRANDNKRTIIKIIVPDDYISQSDSTYNKQYGDKLEISTIKLGNLIKDLSSDTYFNPANTAPTIKDYRKNYIKQLKRLKKDFNKKTFGKDEVYKLLTAALVLDNEHNRVAVADTTDCTEDCLSRLHTLLLKSPPEQNKLSCIHLLKNVESNNKKNIRATLQYFLDNRAVIVSGKNSSKQKELLTYFSLLNKEAALRNRVIPLVNAIIGILASLGSMMLVVSIFFLMNARFDLHLPNFIEKYVSKINDLFYPETYRAPFFFGMVAIGLAVLLTLIYTVFIVFPDLRYNNEFTYMSTFSRKSLTEATTIFNDQQSSQPSTSTNNEEQNTASNTITPSNIGQLNLLDRNDVNIIDLYDKR